MSRLKGVAVVALVAATASAATTVNATQIIPQVQYRNASIEQGGVTQGCLITAAMTSPPAPEIVNLQFLAISRNGQSVLAYKVTAGDANWTQRTNVARRIATANFSTGEFNHPKAFNQSITPEGQLLGVLTDPTLEESFEKAFVLGHYSLEFTRADNPDVRTYYVEQGPSRDVVQTFLACLKRVSESPPSGAR
jgi:hypothetical protein